MQFINTKSFADTDILKLLPNLNLDRKHARKCMLSMKIGLKNTWKKFYYVILNLHQEFRNFFLNKCVNTRCKIRCSYKFENVMLVLCVRFECSFVSLMLIAEKMFSQRHSHFLICTKRLQLRQEMLTKCLYSIGWCT